ncbi:sporulation protein [Gordoniibacillus kamchatkensis]|uniref:Sporulation protein n=1 Tax=Gordoniibacillus kamchatkensis TaxID=1590651 RepID=A0ABR5AL29_9BACL|nr:YhcN/YlaJ family sporulation lipoprotein [Paenibacillus sp. VKM B-2647]KIL41728.1 sporulation protein [Paenibacillus sp. VKM B-2647]
MRRLLAAVMMLSVFVGCSNQQGNGASPSQASNQNNVRVQQSAPAKREIANPAEVQNRMEQLALSVPGVHAANCVVFGNTAVIGIDVGPNMDRSKIGTIKYSVAEALRKDPYGANAIVTADMDLGQRLRNIRDKARQGRTVTGFAEEMADIIGRIIPQMPEDLRRPAPDAPRDAVQGGTSDYANNPNAGH